MDINKEVLKFIDHATTELKEEMEDAIISRILYVQCNGWKPIKSPIEQYFYSALFSLIKCQNIPLWEDGIEIYNEYEIGKYRVDFFITSRIEMVIRNKDDPKVVPKLVVQDKEIIVELDGHEFHEKTEKERRYEKTRDRYFQKKGYKIFHYTGKEITDNPYVSAIEVLEFLISPYRIVWMPKEKD